MERAWQVGTRTSRPVLLNAGPWEVLRAPPRLGVRAALFECPITVPPMDRRFWHYHDWIENV
jgi:hypothetical protein